LQCHGCEKEGGGGFSGNPELDRRFRVQVMFIVFPFFPGEVIANGFTGNEEFNDNILERGMPLIPANFFEVMLMRRSRLESLKSRGTVHVSMQGIC